MLSFFIHSSPLDPKIGRNEKYNLNLNSFSELHNWSIENKSDFWSSVWEFFEIIGSKGTEPYIEPINKMPGSKFPLLFHFLLEVAPLQPFYQVEGRDRDLCEK